MIRSTSRLHAVASARAKDFPSRVGFSTLLGAATTYTTHLGWPVFAWLIAVLATQALSLVMGEPYRRDPRLEPGRRRTLAYAAMVAICAVAFSAIAPVTWFAGGPEGRLIALIVLTGALLNVAVQAEAAPMILWASAVPYLLLLIGAPLASIFVDHKADIGAMSFVSVGATLYVAHLVRVVLRNSAAERAAEAALAHAEAERQRAEQASLAKTAFLATMSHEIRTPLNGVLGMAQAMAGDELPERQRARLEVVQQSGQILLTLLNDLLDLARMDASKLELQTGPTDLEGVAQQALTAFSPLAQGKGLALQLSLAPELAGRWQADGERVRQIVFNLLAASLQVTERGLIALRFALTPEGVVIEVADTSPGLAPEALETLFERFAPCDVSRHAGPGLGLAMARELARLMGGDVSAVSAQGQGTTLTAVLPLDRIEVACEAEPDPVPEEAGDEVKVLIAEDNKTNQLVLTTLLSQAGVNAHVVENGQEAVEAWKSGSWDVVLMDIQMPVMDGRDATRRIRELESQEGRRRTPIIAVTANAMAHQAAEYLAIGMDALVPKPIVFEQLLTVLAEALDAATGPAAAAAA